MYGALNRLAGVLGAGRLFENYRLPRVEHRTLDLCSTIRAILCVESNTSPTRLCRHGVGQPKGKGRRMRIGALRDWLAGVESEPVAQ